MVVVDSNLVGVGCRVGFVIIYGQSLATKFLEELIQVKRERLQLEQMTTELEITMMGTSNLDQE